MSQGATESINLAHTRDFRIGRLEVRAGVRQLARDDGEEEVLEPRVMQVLVALARAEGGIVSRDDLTRCCWEDRIVGEDAINRVISRLRRSAEGIGEGSFRIETITKVGYRLIRGGQTDVVLPAAPPKRPTRRLMLGGGAAIAGLAAFGGSRLFFAHRAPAAQPSLQIQGLMIAGLSDLGQSTQEGAREALGLFRRVTELAPDYARGWGALAALYSIQSHYFPPQEADASRGRSREAAARALAIDPMNGLARAAQVNLLPFNDWLGFERGMAPMLQDNPEEGLLLQWMGRHDAMVGRMGVAADIMTRAVAVLESSAINMFDLMVWQWGAGRLDDADRTIDRGLQLFPRNFAVWFGAFYIRMYTGRIDAAIRMAEDIAGRPAEVPDAEVQSVLEVAHALQSREPAAIEAQTRIWIDKAHEAAGYAENAMQFLSAFGRVDEAFAVADAYFLDRGWTVPPIRFPRGQGSYTPLADRRTNNLFHPSVRAMQIDRRFPALLDALGLNTYWRATGTQPDYRKR